MNDTGYMIVGLVVLAVILFVLWYIYGRRGPEPAASPVAPSPLPPKDEETEPNCADPTFDPRCTILYKLLRTVVGQSVEGVEGCSREIAAKAKGGTAYDVYAIEERIDGNSVQTMFYERLHNQSQEFLITISADNVVEDIVAVDKMLKPTEMLAANADAIGEEYSKFISPLEPEDALHG